MTDELLKILRDEKEVRYKGSLYSYTQIELAYNSNRIEGSRLTEEQTRYLYETQTISTPPGETASMNDIIETANHFRCFDFMLDTAEEVISEALIKKYHYYLKRGTVDEQKGYLVPGEYKTHPNTVGNIETTAPSEVSEKLSRLLVSYNNAEDVSVNDVIDFHFEFERIHPFQDGNGRVGRMIMFKECLAKGVMPFIIEDKYKEFYYRGLDRYKTESGYLVDTCLAAQDKYTKKVLYYYPDYNTGRTMEIKMG
jgi:Fic family protein